MRGRSRSERRRRKRSGAEAGAGISVESAARVIHSRVEDLAEQDRVGDQPVPAGHPGPKA
eukprot:1986733-Rhodomonas_salina.1